MLRTPFFLVCLLSLTVIESSVAQAVARQDTASHAQSNRSGTWSAANTSGRTFMGTWTAVPDLKSGTVTGTWTLIDAQHKTLAGGGWSAARSPAGWTGAWRANVSGRKGEYSGTWTSGVDLKADVGFNDLFEKAVQSIVSGTWQMGNDSGGWSIRASKREAVP